MNERLSNLIRKYQWSWWMWCWCVGLPFEIAWRTWRAWQNAWLDVYLFYRDGKDQDGHE